MPTIRVRESENIEGRGWYLACLIASARAIKFWPAKGGVRQAISYRTTPRLGVGTRGLEKCVNVM